MAFDVLLRGGTLVDGTGAAGRPADVALTGDRIVAIGDLGAVADADAASVIDARGHVVAPGFVDLVVFDPSTVADLATYARPAVHPAGIRDVIVGGRPAVLGGEETGVRAGRLLRAGS